MQCAIIIFLTLGCWRGIVSFGASAVRRQVRWHVLGRQQTEVVDSNRTGRQPSARLLRWADERHGPSCASLFVAVHFASHQRGSLRRAHLAQHGRVPGAVLETHRHGQRQAFLPRQRTTPQEQVSEEDTQLILNKCENFNVYIISIVFEISGLEIATRWWCGVRKMPWPRWRRTWSSSCPRLCSPRATTRDLCSSFRLVRTNCRLLLAHWRWPEHRISSTITRFLKQL